MVPSVIHVYMPSYLAITFRLDVYIVHVGIAIRILVFIDF